MMLRITKIQYKRYRSTTSTSLRYVINMKNDEWKILLSNSATYGLKSCNNHFKEWQIRPYNTLVSICSWGLWMCTCCSLLTTWASHSRRPSRWVTWRDPVSCWSLTSAPQSTEQILAALIGSHLLYLVTDTCSHTWEPAGGSDEKLYHRHQYQPI